MVCYSLFYFVIDSCHDYIFHCQSIGLPAKHGLIRNAKNTMARASKIIGLRWDICLCIIQAPFAWSWVPKTTLPLSYPAWGNFQLTYLQNSTNHLHEDCATILGGKTTQMGELSRLTGRVTLASGTTFLHINTLACLTRTTLSKGSVM